ncbi:MAG: HesA/MoeB/ThiF family protein [Chloroflexi bacterium]|nr:HesA/MoeB/ThiF family protein [Chloroflexota bacterium]
MLSQNELEKYNRQMMLKGFGQDGQEKLKKAKVLVAGAGGLGSPVSIYLTVAGVGRITIVDCDKVSLSNLNRQVMHWDKDIDRRKVESAGEKLKALNPDIQIITLDTMITEDNLFQIVGDNDLIVDAMDNISTRLLLNRAALQNNIPLFHGAIYGFEGRVSTIIPGKTPCLGCLYHEVTPAGKFPVIGTTPAIIGCIQATEVIKYIVGIGELLAGRLLIYDGLKLKFMEINISRKKGCIHCSKIPDSAGGKIDEH